MEVECEITNGVTSEKFRGTIREIKKHAEDIHCTTVRIFNQALKKVIILNLNPQNHEWNHYTLEL
jgi:hypothetical protein